jgi:hypothetical protein
MVVKPVPLKTEFDPLIADAPPAPTVIVYVAPFTKLFVLD